MDETHKPGDENKNNTHTATHYCHVVERFAYSNITVISHGYKEHHFTASKKMNKENLGQAGMKRNSLMLHSAIILGVAKEATHISIKERFASRKYMGV